MIQTPTDLAEFVSGATSHLKLSLNVFQCKNLRENAKNSGSYSKFLGYKSWGSGQWLWLFYIPGRAKSQLKPKVRPGLARLFLAWLGPASGFRPEPAHH